MERKITREVKVKDITIGGTSEVIIQSMTNTDTRDVVKTLVHINILESDNKLNKEVIILQDEINELIKDSLNINSLL